MNNTAESLAENLDDLTIPQFLQRKANPMPHIEHTQPKDTPEIKLVKKPRNKTELPTTLVSSSGSEIPLGNMTLEQLIGARSLLKEQLADMPRLELELRAVVQEIRRKAK